MKKIVKLIILALALFTTIKVTYAYFTTSTDSVNVFNARSYSIIFNGNGGTFKKYTSNIKNGKITNVPTPTRNGYTFRGYSNTPNGIINYSSLSININDISNNEIYAVWEIRSYFVDANSIIDGTTYDSGLAGHTFDVWVENILVADDVIDWNQTLNYGTKVRIKTNAVTGRNTSYDETKTISGITTLNPSWSTNTYESHFYLNGSHILTTYNLYGTTVSTPNTSASALGYDANFYYLSGYTPLTSWTQPNYTIGFNINIAEYGCTITFGTRSVSNANAQLTKLHNAGYTHCISAGTGVGCYSNYSSALELYNNGWNILPRSGSGYSIYKSMSCDSGWSTEAKR